MEKTIKLKEETALLLNKAKAKILEKTKKFKVTDEQTIKEALQSFLRR